MKEICAVAVARKLVLLPPLNESPFCHMRITWIIRYGSYQLVDYSKLTGCDKPTDIRERPLTRRFPPALCKTDQRKVITS